MKASDFIAKKIASFTTHVFNGQGGSVVHILDKMPAAVQICTSKGNDSPQQCFV